MPGASASCRERDAREELVERNAPVALKIKNDLKNGTDGPERRRGRSKVAGDQAAAMRAKHTMP